MVDFGYDISNFREIDPTFGSMEDFENLLRKAKKYGKFYKYFVKRNQPRGGQGVWDKKNHKCQYPKN